MNSIEEYQVSNKLKWSRRITHFLILCILFFLPDVIFSLGNKPSLGFIYLKPLPYILAFYLNYYILVDKLFFQRRNKVWFFVINFVLLVVFILGIYAVSRIDVNLPGGLGGRPPHLRHDGPKPPFEQAGMLNRHMMKILSFMIREGVFFILTIALSVALKLGEKWVRWDHLQQKMLAERQDNELKNLKNQLNPHFLFNTLNNIYSLIAISQVKAQKAVHELSGLLRYVLYDNNDKEVSLEKDLLFVENYISLMRLRLTSNVKLTVNICHDKVGDTLIAPLLFISLIENAFKHGVSQVKESFINIDISFDGEFVECNVENSYFPKAENDKSGSGIGLINLERQLSIIYKDKYEFISMQDDNKYVSILKIKLTQTN
ncbi:MAG: histidine kinase [Muribaculaceae bacterium]|nr:histidine kinase [Muribaculaceae bacterium]